MWAVASIILAGAARAIFGTHSLEDPKTGRTKITSKDRENVEVSPDVVLAFFGLWLIFSSSCGLF